MNWESFVAVGIALGAFFLLGKIETHKNPSLEARSPTVLVGSWNASPQCVKRPAPGDTLIVYVDGRAVAQVPIPAPDTSYSLVLFQNFDWRLLPAPRCSR